MEEKNDDNCLESDGMAVPADLVLKGDILRDAVVIVQFRKGMFGLKKTPGDFGPFSNRRYQG